jgi:hypothetical protein
MTNYKNKYLKYKKKYIQLKKQLGGTRLIVKVNTGSLDGMTNQCFWISILHYLHDHGYPDLTLNELRTYAGLGDDTRNTMVDTTQERFRIAINKITEIFDLTIVAIPIDEHAKPRYGGHIIDQIGHGHHRVELAQYGIGHFNLIIGRDEDDKIHHPKFIPYVQVLNDLTSVDKIPLPYRDAYLRLTENNELIKFLEETNLKHNSALLAEYKTKEQTNESDVYTRDEKVQFMQESVLFIVKLEKHIDDVKKEIQRVRMENIMYESLITEYLETLKK